MIERRDYIKKLKDYKDKPFVKVITGLRRSGKSVLLKLYIEDLLNTSNQKINILMLNFELPENFYIKNYEDLMRKILEWDSQNSGPSYLFLDEVGRVEEWEKAVNAFHAMNKFDIYITGSNSDLMSSDLSTYLAGRYVELLVHPFSYKEFKEYHKDATFKDYITFGGLPSITIFDLNYDLSMTILRDSFQSAILQDVIQRYDIRNSATLEKLITYLCANTSKTFSALSISKYLKSQNIKISVDTILHYINILEKAFILYKASRYDIIGKALLKTEEKYFIADHGYREAVVGKNEAAIELVLENIVYIELIRRGYKVNIGKFDQLEIDFIAAKNDEKLYIQVSYLLGAKSTREREFSVLNSIKDSYPKLVLSMDTVNFSNNGIRHINIEEFLLNE